MNALRFIFIFSLPLFVLSACTQTQLGAHVGKQIFTDSQTQGTFKVGNPYRIKGRQYYPKETYKHTEVGTASWYGPNFHGKKTANGEIFNKYELTAAHRTLQMPSLIEVTNLENGKSIILRVNDRGPFAHNRILDVSERAAELLDFKNQGTAKIRINVLAQESKRLADAARTGRSTRGMEVAYNNAHQNNKTAQPQNTSMTSGADPFASSPMPAPKVVAAPPPPVSAPIKLASIEREVIYNAPPDTPTSIPGKVDKTGRFLPTPVVRNTIDPTGGIFIQAGSFGDIQNAHALSGKLGSIAQAHVSQVDVNGDLYHRVRLGPFETMAQAHNALTHVAAAGQNHAMILVQ